MRAGILALEPNEAFVRQDLNAVVRRIIPLNVQTKLQCPGVPAKCYLISATTRPAM